MKVGDVVGTAEGVTYWIRVAPTAHRTPCCGLMLPLVLCLLRGNELY